MFVVCRIVELGERDDLAHAHADVEEWLFTAWLRDGTVGLVTGYRRHRDGAGWYWSALARRGQPLLHVAEWEVPSRADPLLVKAPGLWAEHVCEHPMQQWTVSNETYAVALDDPADALGPAHGTPSALALDLEWYAVAPAVPVRDGFRQDGVVHGVVELAGGALHLTEAPAERWRRWGSSLEPVALPEAYAHSAVRAVFAFPDGTVTDWAVTPDGWRARHDAPAARPPPAVRPHR